MGKSQEKIFRAVKLISITTTRICDPTQTGHYSARQGTFMKHYYPKLTILTALLFSFIAHGNETVSKLEIQNLTHSFDLSDTKIYAGKTYIYHVNEVNSEDDTPEVNANRFCQYKKFKMAKKAVLTNYDSNGEIVNQITSNLKVKKIETKFYYAKHTKLDTRKAFPFVGVTYTRVFSRLFLSIECSNEDDDLLSTKILDTEGHKINVYN